MLLSKYLILVWLAARTAFKSKSQELKGNPFALKKEIFKYINNARIIAAYVAIF